MRQPKDFFPTPPQKKAWQTPAAFLIGVMVAVAVFVVVIKYL
jgi:hypothetical protein